MIYVLAFSCFLFPFLSFLFIIIILNLFLAGQQQADIFGGPTPTPTPNMPLQPPPSHKAMHVPLNFYPH